MTRHHLGSFRPTPVKRILAFVGLSLVIHLLLVGVTSIGYLTREPEPETEAAAEPAVAAAPGEQAAAPAPASTPTAAQAQPSSTIPSPAPQRDATDAYFERQGATQPAARPAVDGLSGLDAFE